MNKVVLKNRFKVLAVLVPIVLFNFIINIISMKFGIIPILGLTGSMVVAILSGYFLGVWAVLITQLLTAMVYSAYIYYSIVNILCVLLVTHYYRKGFLDKRLGITSFLIINGIINSIVTCIIESGAGHNGPEIFEFNEFYSLIGSLPISILTKSFIIIFISSIVLIFIDIMLAYVIVKLIPENIREFFKEYSWLQKPVDIDELEKINNIDNKMTRISSVFAVSLVFICLTILIVVAYEASSLFVRQTEDEHRTLAVGISKMVASNIDGDWVEDYIKSEGKSREYKKIVAKLENIRAISDDIEYIYVYQIMPDGCHVVFDLDTEEVEASKPGEILEYSKEFTPFIPDLLEGKEIEPVESNGYYGWLLSAYTPVYNSKGETVCYAGVDVSMKYLAYYTRDFMIRLLILCSGIIIVIIITGLWTAKYRVIYPVDSMVAIAKSFKYDSEDARKANVERMSELDIRTGDEIERLYNSFIQVTKDSVKSFGKMCQKSDYIEQMQSDLIMILADMVENRDESTGDHVRKTSMYTIIIMNQMRRMGIYSGILTDDYIENVFKSAPLHDIGKIRIPDAILNKPGKLTPEEFEVMKNHSVYGKEIIDELIESLTEASYLEVARDIAMYHHEKWDGTGYPEGLKKEEIPLSARIMAIADVFDALVSERVYKKAFSFEKAIDIIQEESGTHFDPRIVSAFMAVEDEVRETLEMFDK